MKIKMTSDYSDRSDHPKAGDVLDVWEEIWDGCFIEYFKCEWGDGYLEVYPYECELMEVKG